jgi:hypothetical protein
MKREWTIPFLVMVIFAILILTASVNILQQVQIKEMREAIEILDLKDATMTAYMRDQNIINAKLVERVKALEAENAVSAVQ